jgi:hypothetical protein
MVLHKDSAWKETWSKFKDTNPVIQGVFNMKQSYNDSENVFVAWARVVTDKISDLWGKWRAERMISASSSSCWTHGNSPNIPFSFQRNAF